MSYRQIVLALAAAATGAACAEQYRMSGADALNTSSFNAVGTWVAVSGGAAATEAPGPGNDYVLNAGVMLRTPAEGGNHTFQGDSLTLAHQNAYLAFKGKGSTWNDVITVPDLRFDGGYVQNASDKTHFFLDGNITILNDKGLRLQMVEANRRCVTVRAPITGGGLLWAQTPRTNGVFDVEYKCVYLEGDNSGFTGKILASGGGTFGVSSDRALGAVPETLVPDAITFHGDCWHVTNVLSVAATRGLVVGNETKITPAADQCRRPGMMFQVSPTGRLILNGPVSGDGPILKSGDSGYLHFRGSLADYRGILRLERGVTYFDGAEPVSLPRIELAAGMALTSNAVSVAEFAWEKGNLWFYPTACDPATPRLTVTDSIRVGDSSEVTLQVHEMPSSSYGTWFALVKAPGTVLSTALARDGIRVDPSVSALPLHQLKAEDNGDGTETLWLRRVPSENVYYHCAGDVIDTSSFTLPSWKHDKNDASEAGSAPCAGNVYVLDAYLLRTPGFSSQTFAGDALYFMGMGLTLKGPKYTVTFPDATCYNNSAWWNSEASKPVVPLKIAGRIHLVPAGDYALQLCSQSQKRQIALLADLVGYGTLRLYGVGNPAFGHARYAMSLLGDNSNFSGRTYVLGQTNFYCHVLSEESLGRNPAEFTAKQLQFNGGGLVVTNSVTLDDPNRGVWLESAGGTCDTLNDDATDGGSYASTVAAADRKYPGGAWLRAEGADTVLRVDCAIGGPGALNVHSDGLVALGGANTYTGGTVVRKGALKPLSAGALGKGALEVQKDGALVVPDAETAPRGVELKGPVSFEAGAQIRSEAAEAAFAAGQAHFTVPLLLLAPGETADLGAVPAPPLPKNWKSTLKAETVSVDGVARVQVSAEIQQVGFLLLVR